MEDKITITVKGFGITRTAEIGEEASAVEFIEVCANMAESILDSPKLILEGLLAAKEY